MPSYDPTDDEMLSHWSDVFSPEDAAEQEAHFQEYLAQRDAEEAAYVQLRAEAADLLF